MILQSCTYIVFCRVTVKCMRNPRFLRLVAINLVGMRSKYLWHISWNSSHKVLTGLVIECFSRKQVLKFRPIDLIVVISALDHTGILRLDVLVS